jgi:signal transduction histidine kinase
MTLRAKLLLAQAPLGLALVALGVVAVWSVSSLGERTRTIFQENYRSVLAAQLMKESIERLDSAALFIPLGRGDLAEPQIRENRRRFEAKLRVQEGNITEPGEYEATTQLRQAWQLYQQDIDQFRQMPNDQSRVDYYFATLQPQFLTVKNAADTILNINQDAMVQKSEEADQLAHGTSVLVVATALAALVLGVAVSITLTNRLLVPLGVLTQAVNRLGQGDFLTRAVVSTHDEIGQLANQFNAMAKHLGDYRNSSLGELLLAQRASQAAIDSIPDPVIVFTVDGGILSMNSAAHSLMQGATPGDNEAPLSSLPPALRKPVEEARLFVLQGNGPFLPKGFDDALLVEQGGSQKYFLLRATPIYEDEGRINGTTVILQDVTRLHRFDELKNDLVATVAHEFRTPLTSLRMAIHLCLEGVAGSLTEKQLDLLTAGREDCERLQGIVDDLLDLARLQSGGIKMDLRSVASRDLIDTAADQYRTLAEDKRLYFQVGLPEAHETVLADPEQVGIVLSNLLANAIRHTPPGGTVKIDTTLADGNVRFEVSDNGEGIPEEYHAAIFEKFFRVPGSKSGSAGLGLALSKEIVEAHGGSIGVHSTPGHGATFWFTLPRVDEPAGLAGSVESIKA